MKTGIVDVGGGFRGIYAAGVFDYCLDRDIHFDLSIGVSAGSANVASYLAGQRGRNYTFYTEYAMRKEYMGAKNLLTQRSYIDLDYVYGTLSNSNGEYPLDYAAMMENPGEMLVVATNALTGGAKYFGKGELVRDRYDMFKASSAIPFVCRPYTVGWMPYFDGALADPVPVEKAFQWGCDKVVVLLTRPADRLRGPGKDAFFADRIQHRYPFAARKLRTRVERYNEGVALAKRFQAEGRALVIAPDDTCGVDTLTRERASLMRLYRKGYADAQAILAFLEEEDHEDGNRRTLALLLALCMVLAQIPGVAQAADTGVTITIGTGVKEKPAAEVTVQWDDKWFAGDASVYCHELAVASMALSAAAYVRPVRGTGVQDALKDLGFDHIKSYNYQLSAESSARAAYTFAVKTVKDPDGAASRLVAVIIRGTGTYTEWAGNLNVGTGPEHEGFAQVRDELLNRLEQYLAETDASCRTKFLITGHSRGGAAANLTAAHLLDAGMAEKRDVFAYTFAAPAVSTEAKAEGYENIFNIVSADDLVTQVPLARWGYLRYGLDRPLPDRSEETYATRFAAMDEQYRALTGRPYAVYQDSAAVEKLTDALGQLIPSVSGVNMAMTAALLQGDMEELSALVEGNALAALLMGRTAMRVSSELAPLLQMEGAGLASAHCMAGYYSWLSACPPA